LINYSISKAGACARTISAERLGFDTGKGGDNIPDFLRIAAREGNRHEKWIKEDLPEYGGWNSLTLGGSPHCEKCDREGIHISFDIEEFHFDGHIDDYVVQGDSDNTHIAEYKALGRFTGDKLRIKGLKKHRTYATQLSLYQICLDMPAIFVVKNRDSGSMRVELVETPIYDSNTIIERLRMIESHVVMGELAPCDSDGYTDEYACSSLCDKDTLMRMDEITANLITPISIKKAAGDYHTALVLKDTADEMMKESKLMLGAYLRTANLKSIDMHGIRVSQVKESETTKYEIPDDIKKTYAVKVPRAGYVMIRRTDG